jgi:hypothetical protein
MITSMRQRSGSVSGSSAEQGAEMIEPGKTATSCGRNGSSVMPSTFDRDYIEHAIKPFFGQAVYTGESPSLPMIDLQYGKENAIPAHMWGMLYDDWRPNTEQDGTSVFLQGYENRGPDNERKKIYLSAITPDLYETGYREKVERFFGKLLASTNQDKPFMKEYIDNYFDLYWDLHVGATGTAIPEEVREAGRSFLAVLGSWLPSDPVVYQNYMKVRRLRPILIEWINAKVQDVLHRKVEKYQNTFVHHWLKNNGDGKNFRRKDITFECFHNFLAFSQWGNTIYNIITKLDREHGDSTVKAWFAMTMDCRNGDKKSSADTFSALDRFVMELFRTISPNGGSLSTMTVYRRFMGTGDTTILTPHLATSRKAVHWKDPEAFNPDRYLETPTSDHIDEAASKGIGFARCPFPQASYDVGDGRSAYVTNSAFGTAYAVVDATSYPVCDYAGYAPFGFGYRRCPGELLTVQVIKDFLTKVWTDKIEFGKLPIDHPEELSVGPATVIKDNIGFTIGTPASC